MLGVDNLKGNRWSGAICTLFGMAISVNERRIRGCQVGENATQARCSDPDGRVLPRLFCGNLITNAVVLRGGWYSKGLLLLRSLHQARSLLCLDIGLASSRTVRNTSPDSVKMQCPKQTVYLLLLRYVSWMQQKEVFAFHLWCLSIEEFSPWIFSYLWEMCINSYNCVVFWVFLAFTCLTSALQTFLNRF